MILLEDTRNKEGKHKNVKDYCERNGIELVRTKLDVGDYQIPGGNVAIDTKRNLNELCTNLTSRDDHARFWREVRRANECGIKLIVLCEHGGQIHSIQDVAGWHSKYSTVSGRSLMEEIYKCHIAYGVEFLFCDKRSTGRRIKELLEKDYGRF